MRPAWRYIIGSDTRLKAWHTYSDEHSTSPLEISAWCLRNDLNHLVSLLQEGMMKSLRPRGCNAVFFSQRQCATLCAYIEGNSVLSGSSDWLVIVSLSLVRMLHFGHQRVIILIASSCSTDFPEYHSSHSCNIHSVFLGLSMKQSLV